MYNSLWFFEILKNIVFVDEIYKGKVNLRSLLTKNMNELIQNQFYFRISYSKILDISSKFLQ